MHIHNQNGHEGQQGTGGNEGILESDHDQDEEASLDADSNENEEDAKFSPSLWDCTMADFNAWIRKEGGMSAFVSSLVPNHPLPLGVDIGPIEGGEIQNWLISIIPPDTSNSPVLRYLEPILDADLAIGSVF